MVVFGEVVVSPWRGEGEEGEVAVMMGEGDNVVEGSSSVVVFLGETFLLGGTGCMPLFSFEDTPLSSNLVVRRTGEEGEGEGAGRGTETPLESVGGRGSNVVGMGSG